VRVEVERLIGQATEGFSPDDLSRFHGFLTIVQKNLQSAVSDKTKQSAP